MAVKRRWNHLLGIKKISTLYLDGKAPCIEVMLRTEICVGICLFLDVGGHQQKSTILIDFDPICMYYGP